MKKRFFTILQYLVFFGLGFFLVWWSIRDLTTEDKLLISQSLKHARYYLIIPVFILLVASHFLRAVRWRLLISSLGYQTKISNTFFAVMVGYLANSAVPRLGEVLKCTLLARYEKLPADKLIGTIILERIIDVVSLLIVFGITFVIQPDIFTELINAFFRSHHDQSRKRIPGYLIAVIFFSIIILVLLIWMIAKKKTLQDVVGLFKKIGRSIWQGISTIQHLRNRGIFILYTAGIWFLYFISGYVGFYALQETEVYGAKEAFAILSAGSIGMTATPGGIGAYSILVQKTMQVYGLNEAIALAFGWILWIAQEFVILVGGLISFAAIPYFNKKKKQVETI
ncbi:MAG: hypothetical protein C4308_11160 [Chitinophagaceae bacterium]